MKKIIIFLMSVVVVFAMMIASVYAEVEVDWNHDVDNIEIYVSGSGILTEDDIDKITSVGSEIKSVVIDGDITEIGDKCFRNCNNLENVTINSNIEIIGEYAFEECQRLKAIELPDSVRQIGKFAFMRSGIERMDLPEKITEIPESAFRSCSKLKNVTMSDNVKEIGYSAFAYCEQLEEIDLSENIEKIGTSAFNSTKWKDEAEKPLYVGTILVDYHDEEDINENELVDAVVREGTTSIVWGAFIKKSLRSVYIPDSITELDTTMFYESENLKNVRLSRNLKEIPFRCFGGCKSLEEIEIPESVEHIRSEAFEDTPWFDNLPETAVVNGNLIKCPIGENGVVVVPEGTKYITNYLFEENDEVVSVILPEGLIGIDAGAFEYCSNLTSVTLPDSVKRIGTNAFYFCEKLDVKNIPETIETIGDHAFRHTKTGGNIQLSDTVKYIGEQAFSGTEIESVVIDKPETELIIGDYAFGWCKSLHTAQIPDVSAFGVFFACGSLKNIKFNDEIEIIGDKAFAGCAIENIEIPESVRKINYGAFENCEMLTEISIPEGVEEIDIFMFSGCKSLTNITIPETVKTIKNKAFVGTAIEKIDLPDGLTEIGTYAFENSKLKSIDLPNGLKKIGKGAFTGTEISALMIPETVETVGDYIVSGIENHIDIYIPSAVKEIDESAFKGNNVTVHTPRNSKAYKVAAACGSKIVETAEDRVGEVYNNIITTDIVTTVNGNKINAYSISGQTIILVRDLENMGFDVSFDEEARIAYANYNPDKAAVTGKAVELSDDKVLYTDITVKINGVSIGGFNIGGYMAVVAEDMGRYVPDISCTWIKNERALKLMASYEIATIDYFIEEFARLKGLSPSEESEYFSDAKSSYTDAVVKEKVINSYEYKGLLYPDSGLTVYLFSTFAGRGVYGTRYEREAYEKRCYTVPEIDYTNIPIYIQSYITKLYEDGIFELESINGVNTVDVNRVMTKTEVTAALEKLIVQE